MEIIHFNSSDISNIFARSPEKLDELAFGALSLDKNGMIFKYVHAQNSHIGRMPVDVTGRDFFNEVAPCLKCTPIHHNFRKFSRTGCVNVVFYHGIVYYGKSTEVKIHLKSHQDNQLCWLFTKLVVRDQETASLRNQMIDAVEPSRLRGVTVWRSANAA